MEGSGVFDKLPAIMRDSFLEQALQQLDQEELLASSALVCHHWQQLALWSLRSISTEVETLAGAEQLTCFLAKHGPGILSSLTSLSLDLYELELDDWAAVQQPLLEPISRLSQLHRLDLCEPSWICPMDLCISCLGRLTSLRLTSCSLRATRVLPVLPGLTQLQQLDLSTTGEGCLEPGFLRAVASSLVQLTSLDLPCCFNSVAALEEFPEPGEFVEGLATLSALHRLQLLRLEQIKLRPHWLEKLRQLPIRAAVIFVEGGQAQPVASWLRECCVETLGLWVYPCFAEDKPSNADVAGIMRALCTPAAAGLRQLRVVASPLAPFDLSPHAAALSSMTQLTAVTFAHCGLDDGALAQLSALSGLRELDADMTEGIRGEQGSMEALAAGLPQLTRLVLRQIAAEAVRQAFGPRIVTEERARGVVPGGAIFILRPS